jgi:MYXO-CTERM domain-containing protein
MSRIILTMIAVASSSQVALAGGMDFRIVAVTTPGFAGNQAITSATVSAANGITPNGYPGNTFAAGPFINTRDASVSGIPSRNALRDMVGGVTAGSVVNTTGAMAINSTAAVGTRIIFVLQTRWNGIPGALGVAAAGGNVATNEIASRANMQRYVENAGTLSNIANGDPATNLVYGTFAPYNGLLSLGSPTNPTINADIGSTGGSWYVKRITGLQVGSNLAPLAENTWDNIYAWSYECLSDSPRIVNFDFIDHPAGGTAFSAVYDGISGTQAHTIPNSQYTLGSASFSLTITSATPAPGAGALLGLAGVVALRRRRVQRV